MTETSAQPTGRPIEELLLMALLDKVQQLITAKDEQVASLKASLADCKTQLANALANDAADAQTIADAKAAAEAAVADRDAAIAKVSELQPLVDADAAEDAQIESLIDAALAPEPEAAESVA